MYAHVYIIKWAYCVLVCRGMSILKIREMLNLLGFIVVFVLVCRGVAQWLQSF